MNLLKNDERVKALKAKERFAQHSSVFGSDGYIDGLLQRDMSPFWQEEPTKLVSELEMVRPQAVDEEELQLQLTVDMSREEAEQEEAKRRSDKSIHIAAADVITTNTKKLSLKHRKPFWVKIQLYSHSKLPCKVKARHEHSGAVCLHQ